MTRGAFFKKLCADLDIPWTIHNRRAFAAWAQAEGGDAHFNPLNTTEAAPGATIFNYAGVKNYPTAEVGLGATERTFRHPDHGYGAILKSMRENKSASHTLGAVGRSDWGTGGNLAEEVLQDMHRNPSYLRTLEQKEIAS